MCMNRGSGIVYDQCGDLFGCGNNAACECWSRWLAKWVLPRANLHLVSQSEAFLTTGSVRGYSLCDASAMQPRLKPVSIGAVGLPHRGQNLCICEKPKLHGKNRSPRETVFARCCTQNGTPTTCLARNTCAGNITVRIYVQYLPDATATGPRPGLQWRRRLVRGQA